MELTNYTDPRIILRQILQLVKVEFVLSLLLKLVVGPWIDDLLFAYISDGG